MYNATLQCQNVRLKKYSRSLFSKRVMCIWRLHHPKNVTKDLDSIALNWKCNNLILSWTAIMVSTLFNLWIIGTWILTLQRYPYHHMYVRPKKCTDQSIWCVMNSTGLWKEPGIDSLILKITLSSYPVGLLVTQSTLWVVSKIPYLPVYNACLCIIRTPILDCTLEKKKGSRKQSKWLRKSSVRTSWFGNTQKTMTWSSLQNCHLMHRPRNDQLSDGLFWRSATVKSWIPSAIHCIQLFKYLRNTMS